MTVAQWEKERRLGHRVKLLKAVAHPVRLCIVDELDVPQAIVSQQLRILRMTGVVEVRRQQGLAVYRLVELHLRELLKCMDRCCASEAPATRPAARRSPRGAAS